MRRLGKKNLNATRLVVVRREGERAMIGLYHQLAPLQDPMKILGASKNGGKIVVVDGIPLLSLRKLL